MCISITFSIRQPYSFSDPILDQASWDVMGQNNAPWGLSILFCIFLLSFQSECTCILAHPIHFLFWDLGTFFYFKLRIFSTTSSQSVHSTSNSIIYCTGTVCHLHLRSVFDTKVAHI